VDSGTVASAAFSTIGESVPSMSIMIAVPAGFDRSGASASSRSAIVTSLVCRVVPILLLHGQPGRGRDWQPLLGALERRSSDLPEPLEARAVDRPGWDGRTAAGGYAQSAGAALHELDRAGWPKATIVGHSHGAAVAAWLAIMCPERVSALVLVAPAANTASLLAVDRFLARPRLEPVASAALRLSAEAVAHTDLLATGLARGLGVEPVWLRSLASWLTGADPWRSFFVEQRRQLSELPALEARLGWVQAPARVVAGDRDPVVPLRSARLLARQIPAAELIVIRGGGHLLAAQHPDRLAEITLQAELGPGRRRANGASALAQQPSSEVDGRPLPDGNGLPPGGNEPRRDGHGLPSDAHGLRPDAHGPPREKLSSAS
jgi:pimeloyl-ACP methyl ester carboxylesterase